MVQSFKEFLEEARGPKDYSAYDVYEFMGRNFSYHYRGKPKQLSAGDIFGIRPAGSAKGMWRLITPDDGDTIVSSLDGEDRERLLKQSKKTTKKLDESQQDDFNRLQFIQNYKTLTGDDSGLDSFLALIDKSKKGKAGADAIQNVVKTIKTYKKDLIHATPKEIRAAFYNRISMDDAEEIVSSLKTTKHGLKEDAPTNSVGDGSTTALDEPVVRKKPDMARRKADKFAGAKVFEVDGDKIWQSRNGKHPSHRYARYVGEDETGEEIREYGKKNPKASIVLRNKKTGEMVYLRRK